MRSLEIPPLIPPALLDSVGFDRANFEAEQAEEWRLLGERLELLTREGDGKVIAANFGRTV